jgi:daunorubicin resistance ABC transporter ATP-binding subunit
VDPSADASTAIAVEHLAKTFAGQVRALDDVSFSAPRGSVFGLLGPNGAGKTTAIRILTTVLRADAGRALILGHDTAREPGLVRTLFGLAGQNAAVDENLTGRENLMMIGRLSNLFRADARRRARELLVQFDLVDAGDRTLKTYSGGMRRRLDLAAALVANPPVLFLDEPTTGLDPQSRNDLWEVIERLVREGTTVLLTTQYLEEADRLADRVAVVDHGRVIAEGSPAQLKSGLGATVLELTFADDLVAVEAASALTPRSEHPAHALGAVVELTLGGGSGDAIEALRTLDQRGLAPVTFAVREPSLDDVFLNLTGRGTEDPGQPSEPVARRRNRRAR